MSIWFDQFLIKLFFALGDIIIKEGTEYYKSWQDYKSALKKASDYDDTIKKPDSSIDDKLNANDELGS